VAPETGVEPEACEIDEMDTAERRGVEPHTNDVPTGFQPARIPDPVTLQ